MSCEASSTKWMSVDHQELYGVFVRKKKEANLIKLSYPDNNTRVTEPRAKVLYYISGWLLSKVWTHVRRQKIEEREWVSFVDLNKSASAEAAVEKDKELEHLVGEVERRNDEINGAGLLFATKAFFEFTYALEIGYFHILSKPCLLGAYLGDLPGEMLRVVSEATAIRDEWAECCPPSSGSVNFELDSKVAREVFLFIVQKWHHCRMGDYTRHVSQVSSISKDKASLALRSKLKAVAGSGEVKAGTAGPKPQENAISVSPVVNLESLGGMTVPEIEKLTKKTILALIREAGSSTGKISWRKDELLAALRCVTGGAPSEGAGDIENAGAGAPGDDEGGGGVEPGGGGSDAQDDEYFNQPVFLPGESTSEGIVEQPLPVREGMPSGQKRKSDEFMVPEYTRATSRGPHFAGPRV